MRDFRSHMLSDVWILIFGLLEQTCAEVRFWFQKFWIQKHGFVSANEFRIQNTVSVLRIPDSEAQFRFCEFRIRKHFSRILFPSRFREFCFGIRNFLNCTSEARKSSYLQHWIIQHWYIDGWIRFSPNIFTFTAFRNKGVICEIRVSTR